MSGRKLMRAELLWVALAGLAAPVSAQQATFVEWTQQAGISAVHTPLVIEEDSSSTLMMAGGAVGDFDNDGWQDIFVLGSGGVPDSLYLNRSGGASLRPGHVDAVPFVSGPALPVFEEVAAAWGVDHSHVGVGACVGDYDNDGLLDIFVTSHGPSDAVGPGAHRLYHNEGDHFTERAALAGVAMTSPVLADGYGSAFGDYDLDGDLDLFVTAWRVDPIPSFGNTLFRNDGGVFTDVTDTAIDVGLAFMHGFSPQFVDMNGDRYPELLIAADFSTSKYLLNNGDGTFTDITTISGTGLDTNGMGQCVADFDRDGQLDWYVTSIHGAPTATGNKLYMNVGTDLFSEVSMSAGVNDGGWGWGTLALDANQDGWTDIVETNGWGNAPWFEERNYLYLNLGGGTFFDASTISGLHHGMNGRGLARLDADNDGDPDLLVFVNDGPLRLFRNEIQGPGTHWLDVRLDTGRSTKVAPHGFGARITATAGGTTWVGFIGDGGSFLCTSELSAHFGLGGVAQLDALTVLWPDGTVTVLRDVPADQRLVIAYPD